MRITTETGFLYLSFQYYENISPILLTVSRKTVELDSGEKQFFIKMNATVTPCLHL